MLLPTLTFGQQFFHSPDEDIDEGNNLVQIIGSVGTQTACFVEGYDGFSIIWYDSLMRKAGTSELKFLDQGAQLFRFYNREDAVYVFYQKRDKNKLALWGARIPPLHRDSIYPKKIDGALLGGNWDKSRFALFSEESKTKFVYSFVSDITKQSETDISITVLDQNFNVLKKHTELLMNGNYPGLLDIHVTPKNDLYILMANGERVDNFYSQFSMGVLESAQENIQIVPLASSASLITSPRLAFHEEAQRLVLGGMLYSKPGRQLKALAAYPFDFKTKTWAEAAITPISRTALRSPSLDLSTLRLRNFNLKQDGGFNYVLEKSFRKVFRRSRTMGIGMMPNMGMGSTSYTIYHDDELYAIDADAKGAMEWNKMIMKSQETSSANSRFHSFGTLQSNVGSVFLFVDKPKGDNRFVTAFLSNEGFLTLRQFTPKAYKEIASDGVILKAARQVGANEVVFPIVKRGTLSFAKIVF